MIARSGDQVEADDHVWSRFGDGALPQLPKMSTVTRTFKAGIEQGIPEDFASALAHAAVDPAALRAALAKPTGLHVPGGIIEVIDVDLWVPGVVPMPTNTRTIDSRIYPAAGVRHHPGPLHGPISPAGRTSTLTIKALGVKHFIGQVDEAQRSVLRQNDLSESISARGIVMRTDVVYVEIEHGDGEATIPVLATAEGSSRVTSAHKVLEIEDPRITHYEYPQNRDICRRFINGIVTADLDDPDLTPGTRERLRSRRNALIMPARVFLRFNPTSPSYSYARALKGYLGMLHVDPPKPWSAAGRAEAMAESVLETLHGSGEITDQEHAYLAGLLTPSQAKRAGFPVEPDEQSAYVLAALLPEGGKELIDQGIRDVTAMKRVTTERRTDVVAELALRRTRSAAATLPRGSEGRRRADGMRAPYLRCSRLSWYSSRSWSVTRRDPEKILTAALEEAQGPAPDDPDNWSSRLELAALAQYHLTHWGALRRERMGDSEADLRGPQDVLKLMLRDEQGLRLLHQAIRDGREGRGPHLVDQSGEIVTTDHRPVAVTDEWLRKTFRPDGRRRRRVHPVGDTGWEQLKDMQDQIAECVKDLESGVDQLSKIRGESGQPLIDELGWNAGALSQRLHTVNGQLAAWTYLAGRDEPDEDDDESHDGDPSGQEPS